MLANLSWHSEAGPTLTESPLASFAPISRSYHVPCFSACTSPLVKMTSAGRLGAAGAGCAGGAEGAAAASGIEGVSPEQMAAASAAVGGGKAAPVVKDKADPWANVGRNDPCPCGSGKKYKKCHGATV
jgi:hypothetical protein